MQSFLTSLNPVQREAVVNINGPSLIIAGAGSGKTRVLTYRIAWLLKQGVAPYQILALTFTNKAANEMKARIGQLVGEEGARRLWMGTFHAVFTRILRREAEHLGYPSSFSIYDTTDSLGVIRSCIRELELDDKVYRPSGVLSRISMAKNNLVTAKGYLSNMQAQADDVATRRPRISDIYSLYAKKCRLAAAMDFDDLLLNTNILFRDFPDVLDKYRRLFRYILVDEYQDTNYAQYLIVKKLAEPENNLCVVGDDAQSIYSFRGARIENILNFRKDYPDYREYKLEQNYRSTQTIVNAANSVIEKNHNRLDKKCFSEATVGEKVGVIKAFTDQEEAFLVASDMVTTMQGDNARYNDFAILYRTNAQSRALEEALRRKNIAYKIYGGMSFYQRAEIKDMIAYLRLATNPNDSEAFKRAIQVPSRGVGDTSMGRVESFAGEREKSIYAVLQEFPATEIGVRSLVYGKLKEFTAMLDELSARQFEVNAYDFAMMVGQRSGILAHYQADKSPEGTTRCENLEELFNSIKEFVDDQAAENDDNVMVTIHQYLENVALISDLDTDKPEDREKVTLMTVHSAKGLEFAYVYVVGMEENLFPASMSMLSPDSVEEERRLFYVAITRAKRKVTVGFAQSRYNWGKLVSNAPSRFLSEIAERYLEHPIRPEREQSVPVDEESVKEYRRRQRREIKPAHQRPATMEPLSAIRSSPALARRPIPNFKPDDPALIKEGQTVEHERFGRGMVETIEGIPPNAKAIVVFEDEGAKTLLLKFARLRIMPG